MKGNKNIKTAKTTSRRFSLSGYNPGWFPIISAAVAFLLYANTIMHEYVLDDAGAITGNEYVMEGIRGIPKIMKVGLWHFENANLGYYRPLSMITFAIENQFFRGNPHVSHFVNVLLYSLTAFFLCLLLKRVFRNFNPLFPFAVTLLFIAHPIHTEVVANIKSRDEILSFLNLIIGTLVLIRAYAGQKTNLKLIALSCLFFYLALLSKETAMTGLVVVPLVLFFSFDLTIRQILVKTIPFFVMILLFQVHKFQVLGTISGHAPHDIINYPYTDSWVKLPTTLLIFLYCIRLIFFPHPLTYDYSYNQIPAAGLDAEVLMALFIGITLVYFSIRGLMKRSIPALSALLFCITLAPALAFVFLRGGIMAERFLYAPTLGFSIAVVFFSGLLAQRDDKNLSAFWQRQKISFSSSEEKTCLGVLFVLFSLYSVKTISRNPVWQDNFTLFSTDVNTSSNSAQVHRHYGSVLIDRAQAEKDSLKKNEWISKGLSELNAALRIHPGFGDVFFKLGLTYQHVRPNNDSAIYYYLRAIEAAPTGAMSYNNLGVVYDHLGREELASFYFNKAVAVNPYLPEAARNRDDHKKTTGLDVRAFPKVLDAEIVEKMAKNKDAAFYFKLGLSLTMKQDYEGGAIYFEKAIGMDPKDEASYLNLASCYGILGKYDKNLEVLNKLLQINPNNAEAYALLSVTFEMKGDKGKAKEYAEMAKKLGAKGTGTEKK